eukprot:RCo038255
MEAPLFSVTAGESRVLAELLRQILDHVYQQQATILPLVLQQQELIRHIERLAPVGPTKASDPSPSCASPSPFSCPHCGCALAITASNPPHTHTPSHVAEAEAHPALPSVRSPSLVAPLRGVCTSEPITAGTLTVSSPTGQATAVPAAAAAVVVDVDRWPSLSASPQPSSAPTSVRELLSAPAPQQSRGAFIPARPPGSVPVEPLDRPLGPSTVAPQLPHGFEGEAREPALPTGIPARTHENSIPTLSGPLPPSHSPRPTPDPFFLHRPADRSAPLHSPPPAPPVSHSVAEHRQGTPKGPIHTDPGDPLSHFSSPLRSPGEPRTPNPVSSSQPSADTSSQSHTLSHSRRRPEDENPLATAHLSSHSSHHHHHPRDAPEYPVQQRHSAFAQGVGEAPLPLPRTPPRPSHHHRSPASSSNSEGVWAGTEVE